MSKLIIWGGCALVLVGAARPASAQALGSSGLEVSAGYQLLHIPDETFPLGFAVDAAGGSRGLTWAGEFGWARDDQNEPGVTGTVTFVNYGVGPRWSSPITGARLFVQLFAGGVHTSANRTVNGASLVDSDNAFMLQPGAGVVVPVGAVWGVVGQADYRHAFFKEEGDDEFRLFFGIRFATHP
jgi:Outer membrane protein beta-barrel domain